MPHFQAEHESYDKYAGESFYRAARAVFDEQNFMFSIMAELAKRSIKGPQKIYSKDGTLTLDEDSRLTGTDTSLSTDNEEEITPYDPVEMAREGGALTALVTGMAQRSTFSQTAFGNAPFELSGFAITQLSQGIEAPLTPHIQAVRTAYRQTINILIDAYSSGAFDTLQLSGRLQDPGRTWFSESISPDQVRAGGNITVDVIPALPRDDVPKTTLAQTMREGPVPLVDDRFIRENILELQDVEQVERAVWEQLAERNSPAAVAFRSMIAASEQGEEELAEIQFQEFQSAMMQKLLELLQLQMMGIPPPGVPGQGGQTNGGSQPRQRLPTPAVMPPQAVGRGNAPNPAASTANGAVGGATSRPPSQDFGLF
jgi:hypothetical protein